MAKRSRNLVEVLSGAGVGAFLGLMVGLSTSPVVATVVSALSAGMLALLAIPEKGEQQQAPAGELRTRTLRVMGFGGAAAVALLSGVFLRAHDTFGVRPQRLVQQWKDAGFPDSVARPLVAYSQLGILPPSAKVSDRILPPSPQMGRTGLFSVSAEECTRLQPSHYDNTAEAINALRLAPGHWHNVAEQIGKVPAGQQRPLLDAVWALACDTSASGTPQ